MPIVPLATSIATTGYKIASRAQLGKKVGSALRKGFGLLRDRAKDAKFVATEKGFTLSAPGISAQGGKATGAGQVAYSAPGSANYLPYVIGGAVLLMLLKK